MASKRTDGAEKSTPSTRMSAMASKRGRRRRIAAMASKRTDGAEKSTPSTRMSAMASKRGRRRRIAAMASTRGWIRRRAGPVTGPALRPRLTQTWAGAGSLSLSVFAARTPESGSSPPIAMSLLLEYATAPTTTANAIPAMP